MCPPYSGPYKVVSMGDKIFTICVNEKNIEISIDRVKIVYVLASDLSLTNNNSAFSPDSQSVLILSQIPDNQQREAVNLDNAG